MANAARIDRIERELVSLDWIDKNHDRVYIDTSFVTEYRPVQGNLLGIDREMESIEAMRLAVERGCDFSVIPEVVSELVGDRAERSLRSRAKDWRDIMRKREEFLELLLIDDSPYCTHDLVDNSPYYAQLDGTDIPFVNSVYSSILAGNRTAAMINNLGAVRTLQDAMRETRGVVNLGANHVLLRRSLDGGCQKMDMNTRDY